MADGDSPFSGAWAVQGSVWFDLMLRRCGVAGAELRLAAHSLGVPCRCAGTKGYDSAIRGTVGADYYRCCGLTVLWRSSQIRVRRRRRRDGAGRGSPARRPEVPAAGVGSTGAERPCEACAASAQAPVLCRREDARRRAGRRPGDVDVVAATEQVAAKLAGAARAGITI